MKSLTDQKHNMIKIQIRGQVLIGISMKGQLIIKNSIINQNPYKISNKKN